jgi:hypothetical protein
MPIDMDRGIFIAAFVTLAAGAANTTNGTVTVQASVSDFSSDHVAFVAVSSALVGTFYVISAIVAALVVKKVRT